LTLQDRQQRGALHHSNLRASQLEAQVLPQNIQPHFLMNSLTTILEWVEDEPDKAGVFIELLADEFRSFSQISQKLLILVKEEIALCKTHMEVMGYRLQKTFNLQLENVDLQRQMPPAIIHTLVENGISHNNYQQEKVTFVLRQNLHKNTLIYTGLTPLSSNLQFQRSFSDSGTGTKYIRSRLEQCYSGKWQLESYKQDDYWLTKIIIAVFLELRVMHIVTVEDEPLLAKRIMRLTHELLGEKLTKLKWFNNINDAEDYLADNPIDLLLLDLNINGRNGFDLLKMASTGGFQTIIITAYAEQAISAFEYGILDFVNKPFSKVRLQKALDRLMVYFIYTRWLGTP
jgi:CheY-like chemotaxis protein